jgi:predicted DCC family thiol-disulfide oxidoreductase YuxK
MREDHPIILFDGMCSLCNRSIRFIIHRDPHRVFRFASLDSPVGRRLLRRRGMSTEAADSIVLIEDDGHHVLSEAVVRIGARLGQPWRALAATGRIVPRPWRDAAYRFVARRRYRWFGRCESCSVATEDVEDRFLE